MQNIFSKKNPIIEDINRLDEAIELQEKSMKNIEPLYQANPDQCAKEYYLALTSLAISYKDVNRLDEAIVLREKSLKVCEWMYQASPDLWAERYSSSLCNLAILYGNISQVDEAIELQEKSMKVIEPLYQANPDQWAEYYKALGVIAKSLKENTFNLYGDSTGLMLKYKIFMRVAKESKGSVAFIILASIFILLHFFYNVHQILISWLL